jgi:hypothetical protein
VAWHFSGTGFWQPPLRCQYSDSCTIVVLRHARKKKGPRDPNKSPALWVVRFVTQQPSPSKQAPKGINLITLITISVGTCRSASCWGLL